MDSEGRYDSRAEQPRQDYKTQEQSAPKQYSRGRGGYRGGNNRGNSRGYRGGSGGGGRGGRGGNRGRGSFAGIKRPPPNNTGYGQADGVIDFVKKRKINDNVYRVLIPVRSIKAIIGPKGDNIRQLKEQAGEGCKASIYTQGANKEPIAQGTSERVMSIEGSFEQLKIVLMDIIPKVQGRMAKQLEIRLMVPEHCCSAVIGPKGAHVKKIREETESFIQVYTDPLPASGENIVSLKNSDPEKLADSAVKVFESIQEIKGANNVLLYEPHIWTPGEHGNTGSYMDEQQYSRPPQQGGYQQGGGYNDQSYHHGGGGGGYQGYRTSNNQGYEDQGYQEDTYQDNQGYQDDQGYYDEGYSEGYGYDESAQYDTHTNSAAATGYEQSGYYDPNEGFTAPNGSSYEEFTVQTYADENVQKAPRGSGGRGRGPLLSHPPRGGNNNSRGASRGGNSFSRGRGGAPRGSNMRGADRGRGRGLGGFAPRGSRGGRGGGRGH